MKGYREKLRLFLELCNLDMKQKTAGTALGYLWLYITPLVSIAVIWFVFYFGLKVNTNADGIYSLLVGLMAWQFVSEAILTGLGAFTEKPYLVKKIKFPLIFLPMIKVANSFRIHIPFIGIMILISIISGHFSLLGMLSFIFALPFILGFITSVILLLGTVVVFYRDLLSFVGVIMQLVFWATPVIWSVPESPRFIHIVEMFNPIYLIIRIYRFSFLEENVHFSADIIAFSILVLCLVFCSRFVFVKLRDQFADVL